MSPFWVLNIGAKRMEWNRRSSKCHALPEAGAGWAVVGTNLGPAVKLTFQFCPALMPEFRLKVMLLPAARLKVETASIVGKLQTVFKAMLLSACRLIWERPLNELTLTTE